MRIMKQEPNSRFRLKPGLQRRGIRYCPIPIPPHPLMDTDFIGSYLTQGIEHVIGGIDHLLFAAGIVLALSGFWQVFKVIGIFTIAHSITVIATAVYGKQLLPPEIVEPVVAGS